MWWHRLRRDQGCARCRGKAWRKAADSQRLIKSSSLPVCQRPRLWQPAPGDMLLFQTEPILKTPGVHEGVSLFLGIQAKSLHILSPCIPRPLCSFAHSRYEDTMPRAGNATTTHRTPDKKQLTTSLSKRPPDKNAGQKTFRWLFFWTKDLKILSRAMPSVWCFGITCRGTVVTRTGSRETLVQIPALPFVSVWS